MEIEFAKINKRCMKFELSQVDVMLGVGQRHY